MRTDIHILYSCDNHHTTESRFLHGVATSKEKSIDMLKCLLEKAKMLPLSEDDLFNLGQFGRTQGYPGEEEFIIEPAPLDDIHVWL
jgi:hypothetical protein